MTDPLDALTQVSSGLLVRATSPTVLAPLHLPLIEQFMLDVYDQRYAFGALSQVRWLKGIGRKRAWRARVDDAYEQIGIVVLDQLVGLTSFQLGQVQRELEQAEALRFDAQRLRVMNEVGLEAELARLDRDDGIRRATMLLQARIDQAAEVLRHNHAMEAQRSVQRHELDLENKKLLSEITSRVSTVQRATEGLAAINQVWTEINQINQLTDEDEKHRRLQMLQQALPFLLRFDG